MVEELRRIAKRLLEERKVEVIIGYQDISDNLTTPLFAKTALEVEKLTWNKFCLNNLAVYLNKLKGKIGIVAKGCDVKSIICLIQENQIKREDVVILGVACEGVEEEGTLLKKCKSCQVNTPSLYDELIGELKEKKDIESNGLEEVERLEEMSIDERWQYWEPYLNRCIRCYACRQVCPLCYCKKCIVEVTMPQWIPPRVSKSSNAFFHIIRAFHLAGRCIGCEECQRVCPMNIPLGLIGKKMTKEIKDMFDYLPGFDIESKPPLQNINKEEDPDEEFIR
jgi:ferredoxin